MNNKEVQDAIEELKVSLEDDHLESDGEWTTCDFSTSTINIAIEALMQMRKEPCEWCKEGVKAFPPIQSECTWLGKPLKWCPNCGRRLEETK